MWFYSQASGMLSHNGVLEAVGYSGFGHDGKNNPAAEQIRDIGPIPKGEWTIGAAATHDKLGPVVMALTPKEGTDPFGRSDFFIHGDSEEHPGEASRGCIVASFEARNAIARSGDTDLTVES